MLVSYIFELLFRYVSELSIFNLYTCVSIVTITRCHSRWWHVISCALSCIYSFPSLWRCLGFHSFAQTSHLALFSSCFQGLEQQLLWIKVWVYFLTDKRYNSICPVPTLPLLQDLLFPRKDEISFYVPHSQELWFFISSALWICLCPVWLLTPLYL